MAPRPLEDLAAVIALHLLFADRKEEVGDHDQAKAVFEAATVDHSTEADR